MAVSNQIYEPLIPEKIVVHLGNPDEPAENIIVDFPDYVKIVASNEIYPTWSESAIRANMYAQITFVLNRIYTEWYRSQGYNFDITNSNEFDQSFKPDGNIFKNINEIGDELFNTYVIRQNQLEPLFTSYCDGVDQMCDGLSQWGSVELAREGLNPYRILQNYYGKDISIVKDAPINASFKSYPMYVLRLGSFGQDVSIIQYELNKIGENYPSIPKIDTDQNGIFGAQTKAAVEEFQNIFDLIQDGVVGPATWYRIKYVYNSVKGLEDLALGEVESPFEETWQEGDSGIWVKLLQYYVRVLGCYYPDLPIIEITGYYGPETTNAITELEKKFGLDVNGVVELQTWALLDRQYKTIYKNIPEGCLENKSIYPGYMFSRGIGDKNVTLMQTYLQKISDAYPKIPRVEITGIFDEKTEEAVRAVQQEFLGENTGLVGPITWSQIAILYENL